MRVTSKTDICNLALLELGQSPIGEESENSPQAKACRIAYDFCKSYMLESYVWTFASDTIQLYVTDKDKEITAYPYLYTLPDKFTRLCEVYNAEGTRITPIPDSLPPYQIVGKYLASTSPTVIIKYVKDTDDVTRFSPSFVNALSCLIAAKLCETFKASMNAKNQLYALYDKWLNEAKKVNASQTMIDSRISYPLVNETHYW